MAKYKTSWIESPEIRAPDTDKDCKQVYVWLVTEDEHVVIVSKDGEHWQHPGGKPQPGESLSAAAVREVGEETGLDISETADKLQFFGYQTVEDTESDDPTYLQVRYLLKLGQNAADLHFNAKHEDTEQQKEDIIRFVGAVSLEEVIVRIPWLEESQELTSVKSLLDTHNTDTAADLKPVS